MIYVSCALRRQSPPNNLVGEKCSSQNPKEQRFSDCQPCECSFTALLIEHWADDSQIVWRGY